MADEPSARGASLASCTGASSMAASTASLESWTGMSDAAGKVLEASASRVGELAGASARTLNPRSMRNLMLAMWDLSRVRLTPAPTAIPRQLVRMCALLRIGAVGAR